MAKIKLLLQTPIEPALQSILDSVSGKLLVEFVEQQEVISKNESHFKFTEKGLSFFDGELGELHLDFISDTVNYSRKSHKGKSELIAKATGLPKGIERVFDGTLGLAQDAWFLSRLGAKVIGCERSPVLFVLLAEALSRAKSQYPQIEFEILFGDSMEHLKTHQYEAIYLDPMFPEKKKSALPRKEMRIFRKLVGDDLDAKELLAAAKLAATERVVVKRPMKAEPLAEGVIHSFEGTTVRYDLYSTKVGI